MANELRRIGKRYYVQTPHKYFPVEPHYVVPMFQFLPIGARASLVQRFALGWMPKHPDRDKAIEAVSSVRLLAKTQMERLFPDGEIVLSRDLRDTDIVVAVKHTRRLPLRSPSRSAWLPGAFPNEAPRPHRRPCRRLGPPCW